MIVTTYCQLISNVLLILPSSTKVIGFTAGVNGLGICIIVTEVLSSAATLQLSFAPFKPSSQYTQGRAMCYDA